MESSRLRSALPKSRDPSDAASQPSRGEQEELSKQAWAHNLAEAVFRELPRAAPAAAPPAATAPLESPPESARGTLEGEPPSTEAAGLEDGGDASPAKLDARVTLGRLGAVELRVMRGEGGLSIVIGVADAHVKALIESEVGLLRSSLENGGIGVSSVKISRTPALGTALAQDRERARSANGSRPLGVKSRGYFGSVEEEDEEDNTRERVDFTV